MSIAKYLLVVAVTLAVLALGVEFGLARFMPDAYRGYLVPVADGRVKWAMGPFEPAEPSLRYNPPIQRGKPADTLRIVALGTSGTEGWLTAKTVYMKYGRQWESKGLSSYARAMEFIMNEIAVPGAKQVEVINLGIAAYNVTDVFRMLKDSMQLEPDLLLIQIGGNETWTSERYHWESYINEDIPYLYTELAYEIFTEKKAGWSTLATGGGAFNPMALFESGPKPIVLEPEGREAGLEERLEIYSAELERMARYIKASNIPALFMIPSQNIADFQPFGSMARPGTSAEQLDELNRRLLAALEDRSPGAKQQYLDLLAMDDGIAEANFQLGRIYVQEKNPAKAREHLWKANDRDLVLKRLPSSFHDLSRAFVAKEDFPVVDELKFFESKSDTGVVGYNWLDDDVHPGREAQFDLAIEIVKTIFDRNLLEDEAYDVDFDRLPEFGDYNRYTGFDDEAEGALAFLKAAHNYLIFGRFRQRLRWDPHPAVFIDPILAEVAIANRFSPSDSSLYLAAVLNLYLGRTDAAADAIEALNCADSPTRAKQVHGAAYGAANQILGRPSPEFRGQLSLILTAKGCEK